MKDRQLTPWLTNSKDIDVEMRELGLKKKNLKFDEKNPPVVLGVVNNLVFNQLIYISQKLQMYNRFRKEFPGSKLTRHHMKNLFQKVFPDGKTIGSEK